MAFNGDGPHSKRQRLEESGHRVSARQLSSYSRMPYVPFALSCLASSRSLAGRTDALVRREGGRRVAIYRCNNHGERVPPRARVRQISERRAGRHLSAIPMHAMHTCVYVCTYRHVHRVARRLLAPDNNGGKEGGGRRMHIRHRSRQSSSEPTRLTCRSFV